MKRYAGLFIAFGFVISLSLGAVWNTAYEATPAAGDAVSQGDDQIRAHKEEGRFRNEIGHFFGSGDTTSDDNGLHRPGTARAFVGTAFPDELSDGNPAIASGVLNDYDNAIGTEFSGSSSPNGALNDQATNSAGAIEDDLGHGRFFIDTDGPDNVASTGDDNKLYFYQGVAGDNTPVTITDGWLAVAAASDVSIPDVDAVQVGSYNLVHNGSFAMNSAGISTEPDSWTNVNTALISYATVPDTEGDGQYVAITEADNASNRRLTQTLTELKASTTYTLIVRAREIANDCVLVTTGATTNVNIAPTGAAFATYTDTFITTAAAADVVISMGTTTGGAAAIDDCDFDQLAVYENNAGGVTQHGTTMFHSCHSDSDSSWGTAMANFSTDLTTRITPEIQNTFVEVWGHASFESIDSGGQMALGIDENGTIVQSCAGSDAGNSNTPIFCSLYFVNINPTPGVELVYHLQGAEPDGSTTIQFPFAIGGFTEENLGACLTVKMSLPR